MRHLNSKLFQQRFLSLSPSAGHGQEISNDQEEGPSTQKATDTNGQGDKVSENIGQGEAPAEPAKPIEIDPGDGTVTDVTTNALNEESSPAAEEVKADDDDVISQDSEDADDQEDNLGEDSEDYDTADQDDGYRYEIARWYHHVRQAEILWTVEERKDSPKWQTLLSELDRFCVSDTRAFEDWKQTYVPRIGKAGSLFISRHVMDLPALQSCYWMVALILWNSHPKGIPRYMSLQRRLIR